MHKMPESGRVRYTAANDWGYCRNKNRLLMKNKRRDDYD